MSKIIYLRKNYIDFIYKEEKRKKNKYPALNLSNAFDIDLWLNRGGIDRLSRNGKKGEDDGVVSFDKLFRAVT